LAGIRQTMAREKKELADTVISGMRRSFSDSIHRVWILSLVVMSAMLLLTLLIPNIPLRSRMPGEGREEGEGSEGGEALSGGQLALDPVGEH
jgi:hypothetical protein